MAPVRFENGDVEIDARAIAEALGMTPEIVHAGIREGTITSLCERGVDEDAGTYRISFFTQHRRLRIVVNESGEVARCSTVGSPDKPLPASYRRPGM